MEAGRTALGLAALALVGTACGGSSDKQPPAAAGPKGPPPRVSGVSSAPPPAWVETQAGDHWLAFFGYCWSTTCLDSRPVEQRTDIPRISVTKGEVVRFHLGFEPTSLSLKVGSRTYPLRAGRVSTWRVRGGSGTAFLNARGEAGSAGYVAHLLVRA